ncbi:DUF3291 domain-containing protein [Desertimonas flava]|uniref:DUF3291 domain-containing protein n=1 Tax=Desertimonas flava TaxID=2064846 RepID=UPI000E34A02B|nr:DUF3291 domain-containing protein [Desertimonas flava]
MTPSTWHLAQVNIGRLRAPIDHPDIAEFKAALDTINALAESSPGFVWRLQDDAGNATGIEVDPEDELLIPNMSVWESVEALSEFVYRSDHTPFLRRRREWFQRFGSTFMALWWVPAGHLPTLDEAQQRLDLLERNGPTAEAFTFRHRFPQPSSPASTVAHPSTERPESGPSVLG